MLGLNLKGLRFNSGTYSLFHRDKIIEIEQKKYLSKFKKSFYATLNNEFNLRDLKNVCEVAGRYIKESNSSKVNTLVGDFFKDCKEGKAKK